MRKNFFFFLAGVILTASVAAKLEPGDKSLARVDKKSGKLVFLECEPVGDYDVAFRFTTVVAGMEQLSDFSEPALKKALKMGEKQGKDFDGIIMKSGSREEVAIKFK